MISNTEWLYISRYHSGDILTRLTSDINRVATGVINMIPEIVSLGVQLIAAFFALFYYDMYLAIFTFILSPVTIIFSRIIGKKLKYLQTKLQESESKYRSYIQEAVENITIIKTFRLEKRSEEAIGNLHKERMKWVILRNRTGVIASSTLGLGYWAGYFLAFGWGAYRLAKKASSFGTMTAFLVLVEQVQGPFIGLSKSVPQIIALFASAERLIELDELEKEKDFGELPVPFSAGIHFQNVSFAYKMENPVFEYINFTINPGETIGIVGSSGEGKTTLIRLLLALVRPVDGRVAFVDGDGKEYEASAATRDWIAYVPQSNILFSGTIIENIRFGWGEATEEEIIEATKAACAWDFICELPDGLNTMIGENGMGLSEGQAQRIAIARALVRKVPVLILDEATSSLDIITETKVLDTIGSLNNSRTCIFITHRRSVLTICNRILSVEKGILEEKNNRQ
jgi:ABC-type multidrug transport system fused ATPase/permease subunit